MKMLKKLALVSAISMISAGAFAMEAMDDESMAQTTGQDGITIKVIPGEFLDAGNGGANLTAANAAIAAGYKRGVALQQLGIASGYKGLSIGEIRIHDDDGFGTRGGATANSGALVIGGGATSATAQQKLDDSTFVFTNEAKSIQIDLDMVGNIAGPGAGDAPMLNVKITTPTLRIQTGAIYVANSNAAASDDAVDPINANGTILGVATAKDTDGTAVSGKVKILDAMGLTMGNATLNIQLGNEAQGHMIVMNSSFTGGISISDFGLIDAGGTAAPALGGAVTTGGKIFVGEMKINDNGGSNLSVIANIDVGSVNASTFAQGSRDAIIADSLGTLTAIVGNTEALVTTFNGQTQAQRRDALAAAVGAADYATATPTQKATIDGIDANVGGISAAVTTNEGVLQAGYNGLVINLQQVGSATGMDISMNDIRLGNTTAAIMGDVQLLGLNINGTNIVISGH